MQITVTTGSADPPAADEGEGRGVLHRTTPPRPSLLITFRPHIERSGCHVNRFDAFLGDDLVHTGAQILRPVARKLIERGYDPETLLTMQADGAERPSFQPRSLAAWAGEKLVEKDRGGFRVEKWTDNPFGEAAGNVPVPPDSARGEVGAGVDASEASHALSGETR